MTDRPQCAHGYKNTRTGCVHQRESCRLSHWAPRHHSDGKVTSQTPQGHVWWWPWLLSGTRPPCISGLWQCSREATSAPDVGSALASPQRSGSTTGPGGAAGRCRSQRHHRGAFPGAPVLQTRPEVLCDLSPTLPKPDAGSGLPCGRSLFPSHRTESRGAVGSRLSQ